MFVTCPICKKEYIPTLHRRLKPHLRIQEEFPDASADEREQLISGVCGPKCWDSMFIADQSNQEV